MTVATPSNLSPSTAAEPADAKAAPKSRKLLPFAIIGTLLIGGGIAFYLSTVGRESTDDAQVDGEIVSVPARVGGSVAHVFFTDNQQVKAGELLAQLDDDAPQPRLAQAEASVQASSAAADAADADALVAEHNAVGNKAAADASLI